MEAPAFRLREEVTSITLDFLPNFLIQIVLSVYMPKLKLKFSMVFFTCNLVTGLSFMRHSV